MHIFRFISLSLFFIFILSANLSAREFLNTFMQINIGYSNGVLVNGNILDVERSNNKVDKSLKYNDSSVNFMMDLVPFKPIILGDESNAIKIGFRGGYRLNYIEQKLSVNKKDYSGDLMNFNTVMFGPILRYAPNISLFSSGYSAESGLTLFALYGHVINGKYDAYVANRAYGESFPEPFNASMKGYKLDIGIGGETAVCSVSIGLNLYYSYFSVKLDKKVYEEMGRRSHLHSFCFEIFIGMPLENML